MRRDRMEKFEIFPWDYNFETGIQIIDEQHQQLERLLQIQRQWSFVDVPYGRLQCHGRDNS